MMAYTLSGSPAELGRQCAAALKINSRAPAAALFTSLSPRRFAYAKACLPVYQTYFPEILEEMEGLAQALAVPFEAAAAFLLGMYSFAPQSFCTCVALRTPEGRALLGRNSDFSPTIKPGCASCRYELPAGQRFAGSTTAFVELEDGMNDRGLAAGLTFVYPKRRAPGLNAGMLVRYFLQKCSSVTDCLQALEYLPIGSAQCIALADGAGELAVIECSPAGCEVLRPGPAGYVWATNEFHSPRMASESPAFPDTIHSGERWRTARRALSEASERDSGFLQALLAGQYGFMCQYEPEAEIDTLWAAVYDTASRQVLLCQGNPSRNAFAHSPLLSFS